MIFRSCQVYLTIKIPRFHSQLEKLKPVVYKKYQGNLCVSILGLLIELLAEYGNFNLKSCLIANTVDQYIFKITARVHVSAVSVRPLIGAQQAVTGQRETVCLY